MKNSDEHGKRGDDVEFSFGPFHVKASGRTVAAVIIGGFLFAALVWHDFKDTNQNTAMLSALHEMSYVLTLSESERKALQLQMPDSLRDRLKGNGR